MIQSLTSFRFITAFLVFLFHCQIHFQWKIDIRTIDKFIGNGAVFMSGFFVLSGFIMAHVYGNTDFTKRKNIFNFYLKRFAKIYPTYAIVTIVYFLLIRDFSIWQYARVIVNDLFLVQGFFPSMFHIGINGGTWSLTVEMFLYLLFPLIMLLSGKSPKILIIGILLATITSFNIMLERSDSLYANPIFRVSDFLCGIGFYFLCQKIRLSKSIHLIAIALLITACIFLGKEKYQYMRGQFIFAPLFGLWIGCVFFSTSKFYNNRILEYLGMISYSFYLWQFAALQLGKFFIKTFPDVNLNLVVLLALLINIAFSALSYHLWEERARKFILQKFTTKNMLLNPSAPIGAIS